MAQPKLIKTVPGARLYEDDKGNPLLRLDDVRGSYLFLGKQADDKNDDGTPNPKWRGIGMLPKARVEAYDLVIATIDKIVAAQGKGEKAVKVLRANMFIQDGDEREDETMHGHWLISASETKQRPTARNRQGKEITDATEIDRTFYSGCYLTMVIRPWFFGGVVKGKDKAYPKRVAASLGSVFFMRDGEPFGAGKIDDSSIYDDLADGDDGLGGNSNNDGDEI